MKIFKFIIILTTLLISFQSLQANQKPVVLISGASRGVGFATAKYLATKGFKVYGTSRESILDNSNEINFLKVNLHSTKSIEEAVDLIITKEGRLDILINNAGYALVGPIETLSKEEILDQMDINFLACISFIQACLPQMRQQKFGHIINISSVNAFSTPIYGSIYAASKAALEVVSESLYAEVLPYNIKVSVIEPGILTTPFNIIMGNKKILDDPYKDIQNAIKQEIDNRSNHPIYLNEGQSANELAEFIYHVIEEQDPKLRYQTSHSATAEVSKKLKDLNGSIFKEELKHSQEIE